MLRVARQEAASMSQADGDSHSQMSDPFEPLRALRDKYLDAMAKTMVEAVNTESYAQATGAMLEGYLTATAPLREAMDKSMTQALQQLSLPSRQEVAALAERFTNVEMRLDDMDAKLDRIERLLSRDQPTPLPGAGMVREGDAAEKGVTPRSEPTGSVSRLGVRGRVARKRGATGKRS
jgi:Poly(R)-hydroxyalkanoic acid synthase subunit (PHA_synth_III_E)